MKSLDEAEGWVKGAYAGSLPEPVEQHRTPQPDSELEPADSLPSLSQSQTKTLVDSNSPPSSITPTPTSIAGLGPESQPVAGRSHAPLSARAGPSTSTSSLSTGFGNVVYTDGACSRNGQAGSVAGIGVWWGPSDPRCVFSRSQASSSLTASRVQKPLRALSR
jgi:hypothetical protein